MRFFVMEMNEIYEWKDEEEGEKAEVGLECRDGGGTRIFKRGMHAAEKISAQADIWNAPEI
jgi:hypothetical protein